MESGYHIVTIRVNETSWAHVWRLRSHYLGTGYDTYKCFHLYDFEFGLCYCRVLVFHPLWWEVTVERIDAVV
jgi:hypothetical protein